MNVIEISEFKTRISNFIVGTIDDKICILDFKYRKSIDTQLLRKKKLYCATFIEKKNDIHLIAENEINSYLKGELTQFSLPLSIRGTKFQMKVWNELLKIPYGETVSYLTLSERIGNKKAVRAVAQANGANNLSIVIPCHRVIASNGNLQGYGGGLSIKKKLLKLEYRVLTQNNTFPYDLFFNDLQ